MKSPPELWAEISDVEALARHLGAFGEIRITRVVPETTVAWEGETARGTVELSASGWGTKVTLTATATEAPATPAPAPPVPAAAQVAPAPPVPAAPPAPAAQHVPTPEPHWAPPMEQKVRDRYVGGAAPTRSAEPLPATPAPEPIPLRPLAPVTPIEPAAPIAPSAPLAPAADASGQAPPRGLLARLRWWFGSPAQDAPVVSPDREEADSASAASEPPARSEERAETAVAEEHAATDLPAEEPAAAVLPPVAEEPAATALPPVAEEPAHELADSPPATEVAEPAGTAGSPDEGTIVGILTGVLDELGSAHHRPFSRG